MPGNKQTFISRQLPKSAIILIVAALALMVSAFAVLISGVNDQILASNIRTMEELALHDQRSIQNSISLRWDTMQGAAVALEDRDWQTEAEIPTTLKDFLDSIPSVDKIILLDEEGTEYGSSGLVRQDSYLMDICAEHTERFIERVNTTSYFRENRQETLFEAIPVDFDVCGRHMTWLICEFPISTLESELKIDSYDGEGFSSVIDAQGNYIINIARTHNFGTYDNFFSDMADADIEGYESVEALRDATTTTTGAQSVIYTRDGQENIMVITTIDYAGWYFITTVPTSVFSEQANAILGIFLVLLAVVAAVVVAIVYVFFRRRQERERLRLAEAGSRSKTEFLFNMSHDIRTPMNAILGYTDIGLRHRDDAERTAENLTKIQTAGRHLLNLINDILEMSRIEAGRLELASDPLDLREVVDGIVQMNQTLAMAKSIDFSADIQLQQPYVYFDELHFNEIIINLISNAVKYTPDGGKVRFTAHQTDTPTDGVAVYRFEIADNGIGMSESFQTHLFETFSREEAPGVTRIEGTGLGLSIVKRIVDQAGGTISVQSKQGEGSTFVVQLPLRMMTEEEIEAFETAARAASQIPSEERFRGKRMLLVEDNAMNREIALDILSDAGFVVEEAEDGDLAVRAIVEKGIEYYDFILMDIQMPVMNGYEATRAIRAMQDGDRIPIIALSANAFAEDREASLAAGMNDHVAKPIDIPSLFAALAKFV